MNKPTGLGMWIAFGHLAEKRFGDDSQIANLLTECGIKWVAPRVGDEGWNDVHYTPERFDSFTRTMHGADISVYPWAYVRPTADFTKYVNIVVAARGRADGFIVNAEVEFKGAHDKAGQLSRQIKNHVGDFYVGHAPLAWMQYHADFPYLEFGQWLDGVMPQTYWTELVRGSYAEMAKVCLPKWEELPKLNSHLAKNYAPVGCTYGTSEINAKKKPPGKFKVGDLELFLDRYKDLECVSLYTLEVAHPGAIELLKQRERNRVALSVTPILNNTAPPFYEWAGLNRCEEFSATVAWAATVGAADIVAKLANLYEKEFGVKPQ